MAIDNTPPRLKLIATIAVITVITLIGIDFITKSYFAMMSDEAKHEKIAPAADMAEQAKAEHAALAAAQMPLDKAMAEIAKGTRPDAIFPQPSDDVGAVTGWSKLPRPAPTVQHAVGGGTPDVAPVTDGDAGVMLDGDGGATATTTGDAGAPPAAAADGGVRAAQDGGVHTVRDGGAVHAAQDGGVHP